MTDSVVDILQTILLSLLTILKLVARKNKTVEELEED